METLDGAERLWSVLSSAGALGIIAMVALRVVGRMLRDAQRSRADLEQESRAARLEHEQRVNRLFPGTRSLAEASRVRLGTLGDPFCTVEMLAFGQRAFRHAHQGGSLPMTEGAAETLRSGPAVDTLEDVLPLSARLVSAEQSGAWRTVELELEGVELARIAGELAITHVIERWRLRCPSDAPLPDAEALADPERSGWELQSLPLRERTRLDRLPPRLPPWGDPDRRGSVADLLAEKRARLVEGLDPSLTDLEAHAGALTLAALDGGAARFIDPLDTQLASEATLRTLRGLNLRLEDLRVESVAILEATMDARWRWYLARVEVAGRRWLEGVGAPPVLEDRGALIIGLVRPLSQTEGGWSAFGLWPGERAV